MSLDIRLFIKELVITEKQLGQDIEDFFGVYGVKPVRRSEKATIFTETDEMWRFYVGIRETTKTSDMYYDSGLTQGDFQFRQSIWFEMDKTDDLSESLDMILRFARYLFKKHPADILLVIIDNDICLFEKESGNIYLKRGTRWFSSQVLEECKVQEL